MAFCARVARPAATLARCPACRLVSLIAVFALVAMSLFAVTAEAQEISVLFGDGMASSKQVLLAQRKRPHERRLRLNSIGSGITLKPGILVLKKRHRSRNVPNNSHNAICIGSKIEFPKRA